MSTLQSLPPEAAPTHTNETHRLVRERCFLPSELERVLLLVHEERFTGTVTLDCSQGSLNMIRMNEQQKLK
jgi:hypothetical protein